MSHGPDSWARRLVRLELTRSVLFDSTLSYLYVNISLVSCLFGISPHFGLYAFLYSYLVTRSEFTIIGPIYLLLAVLFPLFPLPPPWALTKWHQRLRSFLECCQLYWAWWSRWLCGCFPACHNQWSWIMCFSDCIQSSIGQGLSQEPSMTISKYTEISLEEAQTETGVHAVPKNFLSVRALFYYRTIVRLCNKRF